MPVIHSFIHVSVESVSKQLFLEHSLCLIDQTGAKDSTQNWHDLQLNLWSNKGERYGISDDPINA